MRTAWQTTCARALDELRQAYQAEVARFAETLRPRFESGELYGIPRAGSDEGYWRLGRLCRRRFALHGPEAALVLAASPSLATTEELNSNAAPPSNVTREMAIYAIICDVLGIARTRGWYRPPAEEQKPSRTLLVWARAGAQLAEVRP